MSADWYKINISGAINSLDPQTIVSLCAAGNTALCSAITRAPGGAITAVTSQQINVANLKTTGMDFEVSYRKDLAELLPPIGGNLTLRWLGSYVHRRTFLPDGNTRLDLAGQVNPNDSTLLSVPHWRWTAQANWERGPTTINLAARYIGKAKYDNTFTAEDINDNTVKPYVYFDLSARYRIDAFGSEDTEFSIGVRNLLDKDPPAVPTDFIDAYKTNPIFYDVVGRFFFFGVSTKF
jgi:hypothetical protein